MKVQRKLKTIPEVETEFNIIIECDKKSTNGLTIYQMYEFIASSIETSIQSAGLDSGRGLWNGFLGKYKLAKLLSKGTYTKSNQIFGFPSKAESGDEKSAETRLKTAFTAFQLHSGPFGQHPVYGDLDKMQWEKIHSIVSGFLFSHIELRGDEKIRFFKEKEAGREKFAQDKESQRNNSQGRDRTDRDGNPIRNNNNRRWKNKKKNNYKGNSNEGGGTK